MSILCCPPTNAKLDLLIPIAVVITAGCENCAQIFVEKAIKEGCPKKKIEEVISIVESVQQSECFQEAVGEEVVNRMKGPIKKGRETLEKK